MELSNGESNYWQRLATARMGRRRVLGGTAALSGVAALALAGCSSNNNNNNSANKPAASVAAPPSATAAGTGAPATRAASAVATQAATSGAARTATPAAGAAPQAAATANSALKTGGTINVAFVVPNVPLNPYANTTYTSQEIVGGVYGRLFRFAADADPNTTLTRIPVPDLVASYQQPDSTTFVMKLRPDAMFTAPLSRALTSADVMASYTYFTQEPKNTNNGIFDPIVDSVTTPDASTVQFKLKAPYAPFLNKLANPQYLWMMSQDAATGKIDPSQQLIGTGPWTYAGSSPTAFNYKKNPGYYIKGTPYADGFVYNVIPSTANQEAQFQAGSLDVLGVPAADVASMQKAVPKATQVTYVGNLLAFLFFSDTGNDPTFKDPRVRQACSMAFDRDSFLDLIYNKQGSWDNLINPGLGKWWLDPQSSAAGDSAQYFKFNLQAAKQLLSAAGYSGQSITYIYPNDAYGDLYNQAADAVRGMMADLGLKLTVQTVTYLKDYITPDGIFNKGAPPNSMVWALQTPFTEPDDYLTGMLTKAGNRNNSKVNDPQLESMVKAQQGELDANKRLQEVFQIQQYHATKMYYVPAANGKTFLFTQPWTQNYWPSDDYGFPTEQLAYLSVNNK